MIIILIFFSVYLASFLALKDNDLLFYKKKYMSKIFLGYVPKNLKNFHYAIDIHDIRQYYNYFILKGFCDEEIFGLNKASILIYEEDKKYVLINKLILRSPYSFILLKNPKLDQFENAIKNDHTFVHYWKKYLLGYNQEIINKAISVEPVILLSITNPSIDNLINAIEKNSSFYTYAKIVDNPDPETTLTNLKNKKKLISILS